MKQIIKFLCSSIVAFVTLNMFCLIYYNVPVHYDNPNGSTDYIWDSDYLYARMTEGIGYGKTNNEGLMNEYDYEQGMNIDVLVMGSSHIENQYIPMKDNVVSLLNDMDSNNTYYNLGVSGHNFKVCITNLENALNKYRPEYVIIETDTILFDTETVDKIINKEIKDIPSTSNKIMIQLQHIPFIRLAVSQIETFIDNNENSSSDVAYLNSTLDSESTCRLLEYIQNLSNKYDTKVIILYHPVIMTYDRNSFTYQIPQKTVDSFKKLCEQYIITLLDMTERFEKEYQLNFTLPYGFANSKTAFGHLNVEGHRMMADEIYNLIKE